MQIPLSRPDVTEGEIEQAVAMLRSPDLSLGPTLRRFEEAFAAYVGRRHQVAAWYREMLAAEERLIVPQEAPRCETNWFVFVVQLVEPWGPAQRGRILQEMERRGIQVSNYFPPVHLQPFVAAQCGHEPGDFPIAESVSRRTIALPFYNRLTQDEVAIMCGVLRGVLDASLR